MPRGGKQRARIYTLSLFPLKPALWVPFYEANVEWLEKAFLRKVDDAVSDVKENPLMYRIVENEYSNRLAPLAEYFAS